MFSPPEESEATDVNAMVVDDPKPSADDRKSTVPDKGKTVSFAEDVKPPAPNGSHDTHETKTSNVTQDGGASSSTSGERLDGVIGQLEVHQSGMIKMRLNNGMLMDVSCHDRFRIAASFSPLRSLRRRNRLSFSMPFSLIPLQNGSTYWARSTDGLWCLRMWTNCLKNWINLKLMN